MVLSGLYGVDGSFLAKRGGKGGSAQATRADPELLTFGTLAR